MSAVRKIIALPAHHRCHPDPAQNYGVGGVRFLWTLKRPTERGPTGIQWQQFTPWYLDDTQMQTASPDCTLTHGITDGFYNQPRRTGSVRFHAGFETEVFLGHETTCTIVGGPCWHDATFIDDEVWQALTWGGSEAVWDVLASRLEEWVS